MIDRSRKEYWTGDQANDIASYLRQYAALDALDVRSTHCKGCGCDQHRLAVDAGIGAAKTRCERCGRETLLLDSERRLAGASLAEKNCPICGEALFQSQIGFVRRPNHSVSRVYIGSRCVSCGALMSFADWQIDYEATGEMERNL